jgi:hypothetical protein
VIGAINDDASMMSELNGEEGAEVSDEEQG